MPLDGRISVEKRIEPAAVAALLRDGMTLGIGGFGLDRKPMALLREVVRAGVRDLTIETYAGGLDVELLVAAGAVSRVVSCHVGLDYLGLAPVFRRARQTGTILFEEWSEWSQLVAWRAAAERVPFATVRMDAQSDLLRVNPKLRRGVCPFSGEEVVTLAAPKIDLAILHAEAAHPDGSAIAAGDPYLDDLLARAADKVILSAERLLDDGELEARYREVHLIGAYVDHVVIAPDGARPGSCIPEYLLDWPLLRRYAETPSNDARALERQLGAMTGAAA